MLHIELMSEYNVSSISATLNGISDSTYFRLKKKKKIKSLKSKLCRRESIWK